MTRKDFDIHDRPPMDPKAALAHLRFRLGNPTALRDGEGLDAVETVRWLIETNDALRYAADAEFNPREDQKIIALRGALDAQKSGTRTGHGSGIVGAKILYLLYRERGRTVNKFYAYEYAGDRVRDNPKIIDVYVCRLRELLHKFVPEDKARGITTVWGQGYRISDDAARWVASVIGDPPPPPPGDKPT
jgi:DNA-binding response OmpR family regulator